MKGFKYFAARLKSHVKSSPAVIIVSLITAIAIAFAAFAAARSIISSEDRRLFKIGVVADMTQKYMDLAFDTMNNLDDTRFAVEFEAMEEERAKSALSSGEIVGYLVVPDGFIDAAAAAEFIPATFVTEGGEGALVQALVSEFIGVAERLADETQRSVFGADRYMYERGVKWAVRDPLTDGWALTFAEYLLARNGTLRVTLTGERDASTGEYYFSAFVLLFAMLFGVGCVSHMVRRDEALPRLLSARRVGAVRQTAAEAASYFIFSFAFLAVVTLLAGAVVTLSGASGFLGGRNFGDFALYALRLAPASLMISCAGLFMYECTRSSAPAVLLQFVAAIGTAYITGFFYPSSFFPVTVQKIASALPGGAAFSYAKALFTGGAQEYILPVALYAALFFFAACAVRKIRIGGESQ